MTNRTPGPWRIALTRAGSMTCTVYDSANLHRPRVVAEACYHAFAYPYTIPREEALANARLIAAAPAMYDLLKAAADEFDKEAQRAYDRGPYVYGDEPPTGSPMGDQIRTLLATIDGEG